MTPAPRASRATAVRGAILTGLPDGGVSLVRDALLVVDHRGRIVHAGPPARRWGAAAVVAGDAADLLVAAPWDPHVHLPQLPIAGRHDEPLLEWLRRRAFPVERRHADPSRARRATDAFFDALDRAGTAGAGIFTAPYPHAARAALESARRRGIPARIGPPLMDVGTTGFERPARAWLAALERLFATHGRSVAVVPRFGPSCGARLLAGAGRLARGRRACVLGHIAETRDEIAAVQRAHGVDYVELYARAGLLGPRALLAHGIHLAPAECARLARSRAWIVHCPTSNEALGSGRMPLERLREHGVRYCLGTDVGAGRSLSMFDVMLRYLAVHRGRARTTPGDALWRATFAGADALGYSATRGALVVGRRADFVLVPGGARGARSAGGAIRALLERCAAGPRDAAPGRLWRDGRPTAARGAPTRRAGAARGGAS